MRRGEENGNQEEKYFQESGNEDEQEGLEQEDLRPKGRRCENNQARQEGRRAQISHRAPA
ncbi:hypothetical protein GCM10007858_76290 [Bradyrhizobium liaoningense]|nr:hypothetical protein GCM10007858_76290 [Bradyrhizobium liaoningense]